MSMYFFNSESVKLLVHFRSEVCHAYAASLKKATVNTRSVVHFELGSLILVAGELSEAGMQSQIQLASANFLWIDAILDRNLTSSQ